ncbi:MAG: ATP synthase F1 subunit gamma [Flavobacteriaceae bacterium]|nr:MAG: ATP synthase F1 subunit gamma [Flavobacteriaceae bacterium]
MANLKEIRNRITSVASTMQITSAMKMVSAAKLKRAQDAITQMRPYAEKLQELMQNISSTLEGEVGGAFTKQNASEKVLLVVFNSNRGLCGGFNSSINKEVIKAAKGQFKQGGLDVFAIGKKGLEIFNREGIKVVDNLQDIVNKPTFDQITEVTAWAMEKYSNGEYGKVLVVYNKFKNAAVQEVTFEQVLPVELPKSGNAVSSEYIFSPSKEQILVDLIPKTIKTQMFKALLDSAASEHGSRMTAMHNATDNAGALKSELTLTYNKARQAAITNEILEIVSGAEALASGN